jgi:hypothetical protein
MKKILTIAATGFLATFAGSAHAQLTGTITAPGTVPQACNITATTPGVLTASPATGAATSLATASTGLGSVTVVCNTDTSTLTLSAPTANQTIPSQTPAPVVTFAFSSGGTGIYSAVTNGTATTAANDTTLALGDTAKITSSITATGAKVLKAGAYGTSITATLAP